MAQSTSPSDYLSSLRQRRLDKNQALAQDTSTVAEQMNQAPQTQASPQSTQAADQVSSATQTAQTPQSAQDQDANPYLPADYQMQESLIAPGMMKPLPEEDVLSWQAPSRPFKKHNRKFFSTIIVIGLLVSLIFFFAGQGLLPAAVIGAVIFLIYVLYTIPPQMITNKITTYGVRIEGALYYWEELGRFWFETKHKQRLLLIETVRFPGRITLLLGDQNEKTLKLVLAEVLLNKKPPLTSFEKAAKWLSKKVPLDFD